MRKHYCRFRTVVNTATAFASENMRDEKKLIFINILKMLMIFRAKIHTPIQVLLCLLTTIENDNN